MPQHTVPAYPPGDAIRRSLLTFLQTHGPSKRADVLSSLEAHFDLSDADRDRTFADYDGHKKSSSTNKVWGSLVSNEVWRLRVDDLIEPSKNPDYAHGVWALTPAGREAAAPAAGGVPLTRPPETTGGEPLTDSETEAVQRVAFSSFRFLRDSSLTREFKAEAGHTCQLCRRPGIPLEGGGLYAEAHHVRPLSDGGADVVSNLLCVCPTCHAALDYLATRLPDDIRDRVPTLSEASVVYHNERARNAWATST